MPTIRVAGINDVPEIVEMQAIVWQDHFLKERNMQVPMMRRSRLNMEYYMAKDPEGCFVTLDRGKIVGSIISHSWGSVGWFGPLEVNPVCQGKGYGKALVSESIGYLRSRGCTTIGCETMAGNPKNTAFYHKLGFSARALSHVLYKSLVDTPPRRMTEAGGPCALAVGDTAMCAKLWNSILPGLDYSAELASTTGKGLGNVWAMDSGAGMAHAIAHTYEMFDESENAIIKLLVTGEGDIEAADALLAKCEATAAMVGKTGMFIRTYDASPPELGWFLERGYVLQGNSVRFILQGQDEAANMIHVSCWSG